MDHRRQCAWYTGHTHVAFLAVYHCTGQMVRQPPREEVPKTTPRLRKSLSDPKLEAPPTRCRTVDEWFPQRQLTIYRHRLLATVYVGNPPRRTIPLAAVVHHQCVYHLESLPRESGDPDLCRTGQLTVYTQSQVHTDPYGSRPGQARLK